MFELFLLILIGNQCLAKNQTNLDEIDYVICYWDETVLKGGGTHGEVTLAHRMGIPVYLVMNMPFDDVSSWILGCCEGEFDSFVDLKQFLVEEYSG